MTGIYSCKYLKTFSAIITSGMGRKWSHGLLLKLISKHPARSTNQEFPIRLYSYDCIRMYNKFFFFTRLHKLILSTVSPTGDRSPVGETVERFNLCTKAILQSTWKWHGLKKLNAKKCSILLFMWLLKRHRTIGTGDFRHTCKVAHVESTNFPLPIPYHACFEEMPHGDFAGHLGFSHNAS